MCTLQRADIKKRDTDGSGAEVGALDSSGPGCATERGSTDGGGTDSGGTPIGGAAINTAQATFRNAMHVHTEKDPDGPTSASCLSSAAPSKSAVRLPPP